MTGREERWAALGLAALAYLLVSLWAVRTVWPDPTALLPRGTTHTFFAPLVEADQKMVLATVSGDARHFAREPWHSLEAISCYPLPNALALGEPMIGFGLLATLPLALTGEPVLAYDVALVSSLWIAALTMFTLSFHFTRSAGAAFLAGLFFSYARLRLDDPAHPFGHGDLWAPLALYFLFRIFESNRWTSAAGLALAGTLQMLESAYAVLSSGVLLIACLLFLAARSPSRLVQVAPKLLACAALAAVVAGVLFVPHLEIARTWGLGASHGAMLLPWTRWLPGSEAFPGWLLLVGAMLGLADRVRGTRPSPSGDPRLAFAAASVLLAWCTLHPVELPGLSFPLPSPLAALRGFVPGLDQIRVLPAVRMGTYLGAALLAGYGALALLELLASRWRPAVVAAVAIAWIAEVSHPSLSAASFGAPLDPRPLRVSIPPDDRALLGRFDPGAVFDYPPSSALTKNAHHLQYATFHGQKVAACYNSLPSPLVEPLSRLGAFFPDRHVVEALSALGFRTVLVHYDQLPPDRRRRLQRALEAASEEPWLESIGGTETHAAYRLRPDVDVRADPAVLEEGEDVHVSTRAVSSGGPAEIVFTTRNPSPWTYRHADPIAPTPLLVRWYGPDGELLPTRTVDVLPLAVAAGQTLPWKIAVEVGVPAGSYEVTASRLDAPDRSVGRAFVLVRDSPVASAD